MLSSTGHDSNAGHELTAERMISGTLRTCSTGSSACTAVLMTFEAQGSQTRVRLTQSGFPDAATRDDFAAAWPDVLSEVARRRAA